MSGGLGVSRCQFCGSWAEVIVGQEPTIVLCEDCQSEDAALREIAKPRPRNQTVVLAEEVWRRGKHWGGKNA